MLFGAQPGLNQCFLNTGIKIKDIDWVLPHQVNSSIGKILSNALDIPLQKFIPGFVNTGNLGSAGIWVALAQACESGKVLSGQKVLILGVEATKYLYGGFVYTHYDN